MIDQSIRHNLYGIGIIKAEHDSKIYVDFPEYGKRIFKQSAIEEGYLSMDTNEREFILEEGQSYRTIFEAINNVAGTNYKGWMKAVWKSSDKFNLWFTKLAQITNDGAKSAAFDCVNTISDDWNEFKFSNLSYKFGNIKQDELKEISLIFAKDFGTGTEYIFRGAFIIDPQKSSPDCQFFKRVGKKVKLIGQPASDVQILE